MSRSLLADWTSQQYRALEQEVLLAPHRLHEAGLFDDEGLIRLLDSHPAGDLSINTMSDGPGEPVLGEHGTRLEWREGDRNGVPSDVLLSLVRRGRLWINLRNVMRHHPQCRDVIDAMFDELETKSPGFRAEQRSANLLISSPGALVHYHLDVPVNMLWHIRGVKRVWVYPLEERLVSQEQLEDICAGVTVEELPYQESFDRQAQVFDVQPGQMLTWPQHYPHRVTNVEGLNVSLSTEHKNRRALRRVNVHQANRFLRRTMGLGRRDTSVDGPAAHLKELLIRVVRRAARLQGAPARMGNRYPVTFRVDPDAPLGFTLLEVPSEPEAAPVEELVGV